MRSLLVIFVSPASNFAASIPKIPKPASVQAFITQAPVKTLNVAILCRLSGLNVNGCDTSFDAPGEVMPTAKLGPVVGTKKLWCAALIDDALQNACYALARNAGIG